MIIIFTFNKGIKECFKPNKFWGPYLLKHRLQVIHSPGFCLDPKQVGIDFVDLLRVKKKFFIF